MRWTTLYVRSRRVPAAIAGCVLATLVFWALGRFWDRPSMQLQLAVLAVAVGVGAAAGGLGSVELAFDRTASIRWWVRRAVHVLAIAVVVAVIPALTRFTDAPLGEVEVFVRDAAGLTGLAALGAALLGGQLAWCLPVMWTVVVVAAPLPTTTAPEQALSWMIQAPATDAATLTAVALATVGAVAYTTLGSRR